MKTAPRQLISGPVSTYNSLIPRITEFLKITDFRFDIPDAAVIKGIEVHIEKWRSRLGSVEDKEVRLVKNGTIGGRNKAASDPWSNDNPIEIYGSSCDRWDVELTPQDVNSRDFGIAFAALLKPFDNFQTAEIGSLTMTVYWH